ncbi:MAG: hypothetical protein IJE97_13215, partial [Thermoguttaceae bacterium]|nr:hypothetical protein [Thermoguttaceae bacterium]
MKRTAKKERMNEQNATKRRCVRDGADEKAARLAELSRALRRLPTALALTCGVCVVVSGCQAFLGADGERFRQGRGEYALNDESVLRDWEQAARETSATSQKAQNRENDSNRRVGELGQGAENDPASSRPILRSAAFDEESEGGVSRVSARKPAARAEFDGEPEPPKSFSERVKGLFSRPKKDARPSTGSKNAEPPVPYRGRPANSAASGKAGKPGKSTRSGEPEKAARSTDDGFALGRGLTNVFSSSKRRGREKFPVDPVLQFDESRFMPSFQMCEQYYSPLKPVERPLTSAKPGESAKQAKRSKTEQTPRTANSALAVRTGNGAVATQDAEKRQGAQTSLSGRELVSRAEKRRTSPEDATGVATSGGAAAQDSATGWGKTRPISVAANKENAAAKASVASVGYVNVAKKNEATFQTLATGCDRFFGWEAEDAVLLDAILEPTEAVGAVEAVEGSLTAYSSPPTPS